MVGWCLGLNLDVIATAENLRKHGIEGTSIMYRMVTSTEILDAFCRDVQSYRKSGIRA